MAHQNQTLVQQMFDMFRRGEREQAAGMFAEDAVFSYPGPGPLKGEWRNREGVLSFWAEQDRCSGGEFRPEMVDLVAGDRNVFLLVRVAQAGTGAWMRVVVYEISGGAIAGATVFEADPVAAEAFFSGQAT